MISPDRAISLINPYFAAIFPTIPQIPPKYIGIDRLTPTEFIRITSNQIPHNFHIFISIPHCKSNQGKSKHLIGYPTLAEKAHTISSKTLWRTFRSPLRIVFYIPSIVCYFLKYINKIIRL